MFAQTSLPRGERIGIAIMIGIGAAALSYLTLRMYPQFVARDYTYSWRAAQALLHGQNPYLVIRPIGPYPYENYYYYPLPAALVTLPLVWLPVVTSAAVFTGLSSGALAFAVTRDGFGFRGLLVFASVPYLTAAVLGQLTPIIVAAAFLPALQWVYAAKPTIAAAVFAARPSLWGAGLSVLLLVVSLVLWPHWPADWLHALTHTPHHKAAVVRPFGFLALLALIRWRTPEGRLLAVLACVPQVFFFYDQLPLALTARTGRQLLLLVVLTWIAWAITWTTCTHRPACVEFAEPLILPFLYLPALLLVLRRPNEGPMPPWADRLTHRIASGVRPVFQRAG
jgi:hypothetical protein